MMLLGVTAAEIEKHTGISKSMLSNYFAGRTNISAAKVELIMHELNIKFKDFDIMIQDERFKEPEFNWFLREVLHNGGAN